ncbi:MAG: DNA polymerase I, partial [Planctomycetes bacterium]|nr:DNA polymerase I [Planctomycetota bacterium]
RDVPVEKVANYACEDADITLRLNNLFAPRIVELGLDKLYREVEMPLVTVLMKMEANGVRLDLELLRQMSVELGQRLEALEGEIFALAGESFNLNSPQQLGKILFEKLQVHHKTSVRVRRTKTGYSTDSAVLEAMTGQPLVDKILEYRSLYKLKNTYLDALPKLVSRRTGKIHTSFNQTVTATGRLSSSDPNLQNIPIRTELGRQIRKAFIPEDDEHVLLSADYSQIELRILAHMSDDARLIQTFVDGEDVHRRTASLIFGVPLDQVKPDMRDRAKAINFGIIYGMGPQRLAQESGSPTGERISMDEAKQFIDAYFQNYPGIKKFTDAMVQQARTEGFVTTLLGRRRNLLEIHSTNRGMAVAAERMAVNTPIQGSAADMIKVAMVHIDRRLDRERCRARMILQVHDELVFEVHKGEVGRAREIVREEMERAIPLKVPVKVDVSVGENWLEAH